MKEWIVALGTFAALSTLPMGAFADHYDEADAVLGGIVGGVIGGLLGAAIPSYPVYEEPAPVIVERYAPLPVVIERYAPPPVVVNRYTPPPVFVERHVPPPLVLKHNTRPLVLHEAHPHHPSGQDQHKGHTHHY
jgi:hypothetical protein